MGKINWIRVLLGGLIAGVVINVLGFAAWWYLVRPSLTVALQALKQPTQGGVGTTVLMIVLGFVTGILAIWLYAAIRPRYGAGPGTAALAGVAVGLFMGVFPDIGWGLTLRMIPGRVWTMDAVTGLVVTIIATVLGAWVYKEQAQE
jgi:hypothetical protein